jgi:hypothetical protein
VSDLRDHLLDLLTDTEHEPGCGVQTDAFRICDCLVGRLWAVLGLEPTFRRPQ